MTAPIETIDTLNTHIQYMTAPIETINTLNTLIQYMTAPTETIDTLNTHIQYMTGSNPPSRIYLKGHVIDKKNSIDQQIYSIA
jgi:hypothetical protein